MIIAIEDERFGKASVNNPERIEKQGCFGAAVMGPTERRDSGQHDLLRAFDWSLIERQLGGAYTDFPGRPVLMTRLIGGRHSQHMYAQPVRRSAVPALAAEPHTTRIPLFKALIQSIICWKRYCVIKPF